MLEAIVVSCGLGLITYVVHSIRHNPARLAIETAAAAMGFEREKSSEELTFFGDLDGVEVTLSLYVPPWFSRRREDGSTAPAASKLSVSAKLENRLIRSARRVSKTTAGGLQTGDLEFDESVSMEADESILAALSVSTRLRLSRLMTDLGASIADGRLMAVTFDRDILYNAGEIARWTHDITGAARPFNIPVADTARSLLDLFRSDPVIGFRLRCLDALLRFFPGSEEAEEAIHVAASDPSPVCQIISAAHGPDPGRLRRVVDSIGKSELVAVLEICSARICRRVKDACAELETGHAIPKLRALLGVAHMKWSRDVVAVISSFGPRAEPTLVELLEDADAEIRKAAIDRLGTFGSGEAIEALQELARRRLVFGDGEVRKAAEEALQRIRSRLDAQAGRLSLVQSDAQDGALSIAREIGQLSLASEADEGSDSSHREASTESSLPLEELDQS